MENTKLKYISFSCESNDFRVFGNLIDAIRCKMVEYEDDHDIYEVDHYNMVQQNGQVEFFVYYKKKGAKDGNKNRVKKGKGA